MIRSGSRICPADSAQIAANFDERNDVLAKLTLRECDQVWNLTCALCCEHEETAFLEGVRVGARLREELQ